MRLEFHHPQYLLYEQINIEVDVNSTLTKNTFGTKAWMLGLHD